MKWITAIQLEQWAPTLNARANLSRLVSDLVRASASDITYFRFPTGDSSEVPGYDGRLTAHGVLPYVPEGDSVWEFGTTADYLSKANKDYETRSANPGAAIPAHTTFVFVMPYKWKSKTTIDEWMQQKREERIWQDVRALDAITLEEWTSRHPAVASYFARYVLKVAPPAGARSTAEFWDEFSARFTPRLTEEVLLAGRDQEAKSLVEQLLGEPQRILLRADSPQEVVAFAIAAIRKAEPEIRKFLEARTLVLDSDDAARQLATRPNMVFIPRGQAYALAGLLSQHAPTIVGLGRDELNRRDATHLTRPLAQNLTKALETMGFESEAAYQMARRCGRSVTILERQIPSANRPKSQWDDGQRTLIPALLAGRWDASSEDDQEIVRKFAETTRYVDYEALLHRYLRMDDTPIDKEGTVWKMRAPVDAFVQLGFLINRNDLDLLAKVATEVLSEHDPSLDLPVEDRPVIYDRKRLKHSEWLRDGLVTTLLQIAVLHDEAGLDVPAIDPQRFVDELVGKLPGLSRDYRLLASLRNQLPLLMEAAPLPLLSALEQMLEGSGDALRPIFRDSGVFGPSSQHTSFLWALEVAAWDPAYLSRVVLIFAKMVKIDPGGNLVNRPINSLREIFLSWHPGTNASLVQRRAVLDHLVAKEPEVAWQLLLRLLPERTGGVSHPTMKPRYRDAGASEKEVLTWGIVFKSMREIVARALELAGNDPERWISIIREMSRFEETDRHKTYEVLGFQVEVWTPEQRKAVWSVLRQEINLHRMLPDAEWTLKEQELRQLDGILNRLQPADPLARLGWLFDEQFPDIPGGDRNKTDVVDRARVDAVKEIYGTKGEEGILSLAAIVGLPQSVAVAVSKLVNDLDAFDRLIDQSLGKNENLDLFALALSGQAQRSFGNTWEQRISARLSSGKWMPEQIATLVLGWPDQRSTWMTIKKLGAEVEQSYWRRKMAWIVRGSLEDAYYAAQKYDSVGRAIAGLDAVHDYIDRLELDVVWNLLDRAVEEISDRQRPPSNLSLYHIGEILDKLAKRPDASQLEVAKREYAYLPILERRKRNLVLHSLMAQDASFFVSILCDVFKPTSGPLPEPTPQLKARAEAGYQLLHSFKILPGEKDGVIDADALRAWVSDVRRHAAEADRATVADSYIGNVLAHSPKDSEDGGWPHRLIRDLIEFLFSEKVETGFYIERRNMRGVWMKSPYEGGGQERELAEEMRRYAKAAEAWPRTAGVLNVLANSWEHDAEQQDIRAKQDQMRHE